MNGDAFRRIILTPLELKQKEEAAGLFQGISLTRADAQLRQQTWREHYEESADIIPSLPKKRRT